MSFTIPLHAVSAKDGITSSCDPSEAPARPADIEDQKRESAVDQKREITSVYMCVSTKNTVLLQTAKATIYYPDNSHHKRTVGIILDGGSQRSYVMQRLRDDMN